MSSLAQRISEFDRARRMARSRSEALGAEKVLDGMSREEAIATYARKVTYIARRIAHRLPPHAPIELDDLINSGAIGLLDALDKYDSSKNTSFGTYVEFRIRGSILDLLRGLDPVSRTIREKANELQKVTRELELELRRPPESHEIASHMGLSVEEYYSLLHEVRSINLVSLDAPRGNEEGKGIGLIDTLEDSSFDRPDQALDKKEAIDELAAAIENGLPERLRLVLTMYYYRDMNLKEIGEVLGVSESRVSQLHTEACLRLRSRLADSLRPGQEIG